MVEIDFSLVQDKSSSKTFTFYDSEEELYDFTDVDTVILKLYKDPSSPVSIEGTVNESESKVSFDFTTTHTDTLGTFEYVIEETKIDTTVTTILKGNLSIIEYTPFSETFEAYLASELPANLNLEPNYSNQRLFYWRRFLQDAFNIEDEDLNVESAWPTLVNALFAKLVVHDALQMSLRGSLVAFLGGSYTTTTDSGGPVKSIETGPSKVEFEGVAKDISKLFSSSLNTPTPFENLLSDICGLANHLKVKLPMCKQLNLVIPPKYYKNPDWEYPQLTDQ